MTDIRDTEGAYRAALVEEYESYKRAGRHAAAAHVAKVLREEYGHDVEPAPQPEPEAPKQQPEPEAKETAAAAPPPEKAVEPAPVAKKTAARRPAVKKTGEG